MLTVDNLANAVYAHSNAYTLKSAYLADLGPGSDFCPPLWYCFHAVLIVF